MKRHRSESLYYITHINNLESILRHGILSHQKVEEENLGVTAIYDPNIVVNRNDRKTPDGKRLWEYANLYYQPRNPMLYRVMHEKGKNQLVIIGVNPQVLDIPNAFISLGNAASPLSDIVSVKEGTVKINSDLWNIINNDWWAEEDGSKRQIMAELLIPDRISPSLIHSIYVASHRIAEQVTPSAKRYVPNVAVVPEPHMFFQPRIGRRLTPTLTVVDGDMFFSQMQTLTISVNTVGVMGKGLASRAKYQFPDVYVHYQDLCHNKSLQMGVPALYKRELPVEEEFADDPLSLAEDNLTNKWFLLFPTKQHWREKSPYDGIEQGLRWVKDNYHSLGIQSIAMPALGCGLGGLSWEDVGPLMGRELAQLNIPVAIYLPQEITVDIQYTTPQFLLGK